MAQIIKHRRGTAAQLKTVTLQKAELGVSTGSVSGITTPVLHVGDGTNAAGFVVGRLFQGSTVPTLNSGNIGSSLNDLLFHDSATYKLVKLHTSGNETLNLTDNVADFPITGSLITSGNVSGSATSTGSFGYINVAGDISASGNIHAVGNITFEGGSSGTITMGSGADDNIVLAGDVNSNIIPNTDNSFDLGSSGQQWKDLYINGIGYMDQLGTDADPVAAFINSGEIDGVTLGAESAITSLTVSGLTDLNGNVDIDNTTTTIDSSDAISLDAGAASNFTTSAGTLTISGAGGITATSTGGTLTLNGAGQTVDIDGAAINIDASSALSLDAAAASNFSTSDGAITIDGKAGINIKENGTNVIVIDTNQDTLFGATGGSTSDPDVEFDGYTRFDGLVEVANSTNSTSTSTGAFVVDGGVGIANNLNVGGNAVITGDLTVVGTNTYVSSSIVEIGDSIVTLNALNNAVDGGIQVIDVSGSSTGSAPNPTGSLLWNAANDYWYSGVSGSTHYRLPQQASNGALTENRVLIADANGRIEPSANITDNGTTIDVNDVDITSIDKLEGVDANTFIDIGSSDVIETKGNIVPNANNADTLGTDAKRFSDLFLDGNADIDGTLNVQGIPDFQAKVHAQAGIEVTGSIFVSAGASVEATGSNVGSRIAFRNESNTQIGYLSSDMTGDVISGIIGYNESNNNLTVSNVIDGGSF
tara:strand:- start:1656 stop:3767 length:2112 start_codon:yes stop_codon:yes gene_type:complete